MQASRFPVACLQLYRCIGTSGVNSSSSREGRFMQKMMRFTKKTRKVWYDTSTDLRRNTEVIGPAKSISVHTQRRMKIRNNLFMQYITDMMSMGLVSDIINASIEITHVEITADFKYVNVFWINSNAAMPVDEEALQKCARIIRHELSQLRIIGTVPPIQFVKNKRLLMQKETEQKLASLDNNKESLLPEHMQLAALHVSNALDIVYKEPNKNHDIVLDGLSTELPAMRHDVLGLDHKKIMSRITTLLSKSKTAAQKRILNVNKNTDKSACDMQSTASNADANFLTQQQQQQIFSKFLKERQLEEKRLNRMRQHNQEQLDVKNSEVETDSEYEDSEYEDDYDEDSDEFEGKI